MSKVFFTADTHFGHGNIIKYCNRNDFLADIDRKAWEEHNCSWHDGDWKGDRSSNWRISREAIENMDDTIIKNINSLVGENDTLYHLGDFCFAPKHDLRKAAANYRRRINCKNITFIWGNHDSFMIRELFNNCYDLYNANINGQRIVLCHYAMAVFDKSHRGAWHLYGHSHSNAEQWLDKVMPGRRTMDVGVDNAYKILGEYRPFSYDEIAKIMDNRNGFHFDHHGVRKSPTEEEGPTEEELMG